MTKEKAHQPSEAMVDETLAESFPASDPPAWTLGVDSSEPAAAPKGARYTTRDAVLKLLSDDELARVATLEGAPGLADGEEYIDLARIERGVLKARAAEPVDMHHALPRSAVSEATWQKILGEARSGWQSPPAA